MSNEQILPPRVLVKGLLVAAMSVAALGGAGAALGQDATPTITPYIQGGLKFSYRAVAQISSKCPMVIQTNGFAAGEIVTSTVDWPRIKGINYYPEQDPTRVSFSGEIISKSSMSRNQETINSSIFFELPSGSKDGRKLLKALRDVRRECGGSPGPDEVG